MNFQEINKKNTPFIIAEIGNNHEGNFNTAVKLIYAAKNSGVDAVKFQTFKTEYYVNNLEKKRFKKLKKFELTKEQFVKLSIIAKKNKLKFISTPFDLQSANFLKKIVNIFKISSGDNNYFDLIKKVFKYGKPTIISTGLTEITDLKNIIQLAKKKKFNLKKLAMLHCVSSYPVEDKNANLKSIRFMQKRLPVTIGYSDHTLGMAASLTAVSLGAKIIEKHFTLDNNYSNFRDHKLSLNPKNMKLMVSEAKKIPNMLGKENKKPNKTELKTLNQMRRSIYAKKDLKKGDILLVDDLKIVRPFVYLKPNDIEKILGKKIKKNVKSGYPINLKK
tara:strand:+ start:2287 stop:3282 length:996 start_codon:yes stop_codon:yes gene_type:complete